MPAGDVFVAVRSMQRVKLEDYNKHTPNLNMGRELLYAFEQMPRCCHGQICLGVGCDGKTGAADGGAVAG